MVTVIESLQESTRGPLACSRQGGMMPVVGESTRKGCYREEMSDGT